MNSYFSLTAAPGRSTLLLFSGTRFPSRPRGFSAPARGAGPARTAPAVARRRRAPPDRRAPNSRAWSRSARVRGRLGRWRGTRRPPSWPLPRGTQACISDTFLTRIPSLSGMDLRGSAVRKVGGTPFDALRPRYAGGRPPTFTLAQRQQIKKIALSRPADHDLPFSTWSLAKLADFLVAEGVVADISHEGLRLLLREEGVSFQAIKTWKSSTDPDYEAKKNRILELYAIADGPAPPGPGDPTVVICMDEFGPLNL